MRSWLVSLAALFVALGTALLSAPAQAGTTAVMVFSSSPSPGFGTVAVGQSPTRTFTLTNTSTSATGAITVTLTPSGSFTIPTGGDKCTGTALGPKKTCTIAARYTPAGAGASDTATLTASAKKPAAQAAVLTLSGSSPAALSTGCQLVNAEPTSTGFSGVDLNAGEVITLTVPADFPINTGIVVFPPTGHQTASPGTMTENPTHYTVLTTGRHSSVSAPGTTTGDGHVWSCGLP